MPKFGFRIKIIFVLAILVAILILASATAMERSRLSFVENGLRNFLAPMQNGATIISEKISQIPQYFVGMDTLTERNKALEARVAELQGKLEKLADVNVQNTYLKELLGLKEEMADWKPVAVSVIGRSYDAWYNTITIKGGTDQGFKQNMPIITADGLVGRILSVSDSSSEVLLITDKESAVGAMMQLSHLPGVVEAATDSVGSLYMIHVPYDAQVETNQVVMTSGLGGIFPQGLRIGYVTKVDVEPGDLMLQISVQPFVDFERLEIVFVLTNVPTTIVGTALVEPVTTSDSGK